MRVKTSCVAVTGAVDTVCPRPRAITQLHKAFIDAMAVDSACFDLLTSNLVRVIAREVGNLLNNFDVLWTFRSRLMAK